jgi:hypothetical protein
MKLTLFDNTSTEKISSIEWSVLMKRIRDGYWRDIVERSRREATGYDELKRRLPAFGISVTFTGGDEAANVVKYTQIMGIDFNKVVADNISGAGKIEQCREMCQTLRSVIGFFITKSGRGFRLFVRVSTDIEHHRIVYHTVQEYFEQLFGLPSDDKYQDITKLSFVSYDPDCFYREIESAVTFPVDRLIPASRKAETAFREQKDIISNIVKYLSDTYQFRYNTLTAKMQIRVKNDIANVMPSAKTWTDVDDHTNDKLVCDVNSNCTSITYNQMKWLMDNHYIGTEFDPVATFLTNNPDWPLRYFRKASLKKFIAKMVTKWKNPNDTETNMIEMPLDSAMKILPEPLRPYLAIGPHDDLNGKLLAILDEEPPYGQRIPQKLSIVITKKEY